MSTAVQFMKCEDPILGGFQILLEKMSINADLKTCFVLRLLSFQGLEALFVR
jgi:hypothetical protein